MLAASEDLLRVLSNDLRVAATSRSSPLDPRTVAVAECRRGPAVLLRMDDDLEAVLFGLGVLVLLAGIVGSAFYFAARAERRRAEKAEPDLLDVVHGVMMLGAEFASPETRRRFHDPKS